MGLNSNHEFVKNGNDFDWIMGKTWQFNSIQVSGSTHSTVDPAYKPSSGP